jgi:uncharacterized repeat protein (TIGR01451 family)
MKKFILLFLIVCAQFKGKSQGYVTIPDPGFVTFLQNNYPGCMNGNQMDTTCAAIVNLQQLNIWNSSIADLNGLKYFDNLRYLVLGVDLLNNLPELPARLKSIRINGSLITNLSLEHDSIINVQLTHNVELTSIAALPSSLEQFGCYLDSQLVNISYFPNTTRSISVFNCSLSSMPPLPISLDTLNCRFNNFTAIPVLPPTATFLWVSDDHLTSLPTLPLSLKFLACFNNQLANLPNLPASLETLMCHDNILTSLPNLSSSLISLYCYNNQISSLPSLPDSLRSLSCGSNNLTSLPPFPSHLQYLNCSGNNINNLPNLPEMLVVFYCANNQISCFPHFPSSIDPTNGMGALDISGNPFTCLPNYLPGMHPYLYAYPLCLNDSANSNGCSSANAITGFTYHDMNNDCSRQLNDTGLRNIYLQKYDSMGVLVGQTYSSYQSFYAFNTNDTGQYKILLDTLSTPYTYQCLNPGVDSTVQITSFNPAAHNVNFNIQCKPGFDVGVRSIIPSGNVFPGDNHTLMINAGDISQWYGLNCAAGSSGQVQISVSGPVTYTGFPSIALTPSVSGNTYTYTISDFANINNSNAFLLNFTTNTNAQIGDSICVTVSVTPVSGDVNPANNTMHFCYPVRNSHDPNIKETYPEFVMPGYDDYFTYTIHFQNSGSAPAQRVVLLDMLDTNLLAETFELINYSHPNRVSIQKSSWWIADELMVAFDNIMLADSISDPEGSTGFIQYRIKPKPNLPAGTRILNAASILFDYNAGVSTNESVNEYVLPTGVTILNAKKSINVSPNPGNSIFSFSNIEPNTRIEIYDLGGRLITSTEESNVDFSGKDKGMYIYKVISENSQIYQGKLILQ